MFSKIIRVLEGIKLFWELSDMACQKIQQRKRWKSLNERAVEEEATEDVLKSNETDEC